MASSATHYAVMRFHGDGTVTWSCTVRAEKDAAATFREMMLGRVEAARDDDVYYMQPIRMEHDRRVVINPNEGRWSKPHVFRWVEEAGEVHDPRVVVVKDLAT